MSEHAEKVAEPTWRDVAIARPEAVQAYLQERGPLPDGPVTKESWEPFWAWLRARAGQIGGRS